MTGAFLILAVTVAVGVLLWGWEKARTRRHGSSLHHHARPETTEGTPLPSESVGHGEEEAGSAQPPAVCCGLHAICEKTGQINEPPEYYDDEELDRFAGREAGDYSDDEIEEFRDVLLTLLPSDVSGWAVSLEKRHIELPAVLRPELELMLCESHY